MKKGVNKVSPRAGTGQVTQYKKYYLDSTAIHMHYKKYIQRLYEPIAIAPKMFYRAVLQSSLWSLFEVYTIILVMRITNAIAL